MNLHVSTTSTHGNYLVAFVGGGKSQKFVFIRPEYREVVVDTVLQSLGSIMYAPDILMKKVSSSNKE